MLRRDLLTAETQKIARALARIMGLKLEGETAASDQMLLEVLENEYGILYDELLESDTPTFQNFLTDQAFNAEKLDLLSQLLYNNFDPLQRNDLNNSLAEKLQQIYNLLETKHHIVNMLNIGRQKILEKHLAHL